MTAFTPTRRALLATTALGLGAIAVPAIAGASPSNRLPATARPFPLQSVRLLESDFSRAIESNRKYLHALEPDRLLSNFRTYAGLEPKGEVYGGWEQDTIAGHSLGHYLVAVSLMYAQTGDAEMKRRADYIVNELAACQAASGDGYVAGFNRRRGDIIENGKLLFPELMAGDIRSQGFDLNGCWVPLYNWHKLFDGLFHAETYCGNQHALNIAIGLGEYIDHVFAEIPDENVQTILDCEHGGINESFAELYARTGDAKWMSLAERLRHKRILDPLVRHEDSLSYVHANTQIPKVIGLARIHELTGNTSDAEAAKFFWNTVINDYTYVIGGNADREYFPAPHSVSKHITEQTCESCNTYNMLKLTRQLFSWKPQSHLFDYYERAHLNHILAHQDPETGMFAYMVPLMSGEVRPMSTPFDSFWCCVGSGMESHSKHGDSIYWQGDDTLFVNLFIPSQLNWEERKAKITLNTQYPFDGRIDLSLDQVERRALFSIAMRIPSWASQHDLRVNGKTAKAKIIDGYAIINRRWSAGDKVTLTLPLELRTEATPDDANVVALLRGPLVLAGDMGPGAEALPPGVPPALVGSDVLAGFLPVDPSKAKYQATNNMRPGPLIVWPFYQQWHRRTAVYFNKYTEAGWVEAEASVAAQQSANAAIQARTVDVVHLGQMQAERDHELDSNISYPGVYRGRHGRDARSDGYFEFKMKVGEGPMSLIATYWGDERNKDFNIFVDGKIVATQTLNTEKPGEFFDMTYPIPPELTQGKSQVLIRFQPSHDTARCGPVYGVRMLSD